MSINQNLVIANGELQFWQEFDGSGLGYDKPNHQERRQLYRIAVG